MSRCAIVPPRAASRSSSDIAAAIHVASACVERRGDSALTMPPAPCCALSSPLSSRPNRYGPRWETTITRRGPPSELAEQAQPVLELAGREEVAAHVLAPGRAHLVG